MAAFKILQEEAFCIFHPCNFHCIYGLNLLKYLTANQRFTLSKIP